MNIEIIPATEEEVGLIEKEINSFNRAKVPEEQAIIKKNYVIKDNEKIIAGINAIIYHTCVYIDVLFVAAKFRKQKLGSKLLEKVEKEAKEMGILLSHLDTFDFPAKDFI